MVSASLHQQLVNAASDAGKGVAQPKASDLQQVWLHVIGCAGTTHLHIGRHSGSLRLYDYGVNAIAMLDGQN